MTSNNTPVVWFIDDDYGSIRDYIEELNERGLDVRSKHSADEAFELFDTLREIAAFECDLLVIDMKMGLPTRSEYKSRIALPAGKARKEHVGAYLIEDLRRWNSVVDIVVLSQYSAEINAPPLWESYVVLNNLKDERGRHLVMPANQDEVERILKVEFKVQFRQKADDDDPMKIVREIEGWARQALDRLRRP